MTGDQTFDAGKLKITVYFRVLGQIQTSTFLFSKELCVHLETDTVMSNILITKCSNIKFNTVNLALKRKVQLYHLLHLVLRK